MTPAEYGIHLYRGVTFSKTIYLKNDDGTVKDLTGATVVVKFVSQDGDTTYASLTEGNGVTTTANQGKIVFTLSSAQTQNLPDRLPKVFYYVNVTESGTVTRYMQGPVSLSV